MSNIQVEYIENNSASWEDESEYNKARCRVKFSHLEEVVEFVADINDIYDYSVAILNTIRSGDVGPVRSFAEVKAEIDTLRSQSS